jgi:hypothetical protein
MSDMPSIPKVTKIAILNPYLQRNLTESSEMEASMRFIDAAKKLGIEAKIFSRNEDIYDFNPDFVIPISHQEPKLTSFPTYGLFINPLQWVLSSERFVRNIFTYDGYFLVSPHIYNWLKEICTRISKPLYTANAAFSVPKTVFQPLDYKNAKAAYMGVNWDGLRHFDLFQNFKDGKDIICYGPKESWAKYPTDLYAGMLPFDGISTLKAYAACGAGLGINHAAMDDEGIPTCRTFEIAAASAIAICTENKYIREYYNDSVLYVDKNLSTNELADAIKEKIQWIRSNPNLATEMAKSAHDIFNNQLSLECFIENMVNMHYQFIRDNGFIKQTEVTASKKPKITYLIPADENNSIKNILQDVHNQTYNNIDIILLAANEEVEKNLKQQYKDELTIISYSGLQNNPALLQHLIDNDTRWVGFLNVNDKIYKNHCTLLINNYQQSQHDKSDESTVVLFSSSLEHSTSSDLRDKLQDAHMLYLTNNNRVGNLTPCGDIPLCSVLFKLTPTMFTAFQAIDYSKNIRVNYALSSTPFDLAIHVNEVTCSAAVLEADKASVLTIENMNSPINFPSNYTSIEGKLLVDARQRQKMSETE